MPNIAFVLNNTSVQLRPTYIHKMEIEGVILIDVKGMYMRTVYTRIQYIE